MEYWSQKPNIFRGLMIFGSVLVFILIGFYLQRIITSTTDENIFREQISRIKIAKPIKVYKSDTTNIKNMIADTIIIKPGAKLYST